MTNSLTVGLGKHAYHHQQQHAQAPSVQAQIVNLIYATRTLMRSKQRLPPLPLTIALARSSLDPDQCAADGVFIGVWLKNKLDARFQDAACGQDARPARLLPVLQDQPQQRLGQVVKLYGALGGG